MSGRFAGSIRGKKHLAQHYDVATLTVRPGTHPSALAVLEKTLPGAAELRAVWFSELGALNQIMLIRDGMDPAKAIGDRQRQLGSGNPFGVGEFLTAITMDTYVSFDFIAPLRPGEIGPFFEVRTYMLKINGLTPTNELWRKAVPGRATVSPVLAAMASVTGPVTRFMHIWPYKSLDERGRLRAKAVADGVWPPPGGPSHLASQQSDIYLPASFSPIR